MTSGGTFGAGLGKRSYPVYMSGVDSSGVCVPGVPVLACGGGRADMAGNLNLCEGRESDADPRVRKDMRKTRVY